MPSTTTIGIHSPYGFADPLRVKLGNVVPGEPLKIEWFFRRHLDPWDPDWGRSWNGPVLVRFFVEGHLVHERADITGVNESSQSDTLTVGDRSVADEVYRFGRKTLEIVLTRVDQPAAKPFRWHHNFWVVPEAIGPLWWEWRVSLFEEIPWKDGYLLIADFVNHSRFADVKHLAVELSEVRAEEDPQIDPCGYLPVQVEARNDIAPAARTPFSFAFRQDWSWLMGVTYVIYAPTQKTFAYAALFRCTDEFGNVYKGVCSPRLKRYVVVSNKKTFAGATAFGAAASAAALIIAAGVAAATIVGLPLAAVLAASAAAAYTAASVAGAIAKDPPAPDPRFGEPVEVESVELPWPADPSPLPPPVAALRKLLEAALRILALENAHTVVRSRLMGAALFGDARARDRQTRRYVKIEEEMVAVAGRLGLLLSEIEKAEDPHLLFDPEKAGVWADRIVAGGLPPALTKVMAEAGLDESRINELAALVSDRWLMDGVRQRGLLLVPFVTSLQEFVVEVQAQRASVLAGEEYVGAPEERDGDSQFYFVEHEVQPRARPHH